MLRFPNPMANQHESCKRTEMVPLVRVPAHLSDFVIRLSDCLCVGQSFGQMISLP